MQQRAKSVIIMTLQTIVFGFMTFFSGLMLFHAFILATPLWAFLWTFWFFSLFTIITNVSIRIIHQIGIAFLHLLIVLDLLFMLMGEVLFNVKYGILSSAIILVFLAILYTILLVIMVKKYFPMILDEIKKIFTKISGKNSPEGK